MGVEHVIPQSFGKFATKTPTLKCVCDECNAYFSKELDLLLARDTLEGVTRSKKGIPSGAKNPPKILRFALEETPENGHYGGALLAAPDPKTGHPGVLVPQFWIRNTQKKRVGKISEKMENGVRYPGKWGQVPVFTRKGVRYHFLVCPLVAP